MQYGKYFMYLVGSLIGAFIMNKFVPLIELGDCLNYLLLCGILSELLDWKYYEEPKEEEYNG